MEFPALLAFVSALFALAVALAVVWYERRSLSHWVFVVGIAVLATESVFSGLASDAIEPEAVVSLQSWKLLAMSFLPAIWLLFSLTYARGNYQEFLAKWKWMLAATFLCPVGLAVLFRTKLVSSIGRVSTTDPWILRLAPSGTILHLLFLLGSVLILMNLERTYRSSVGTMRWRIKFMILGLGVLFAVRAYSSTQVLLFHALDASMQGINSGALLLGSLLAVRSLSRSGHFNVSVYPSHSVLQNSLTILLAGIYLLIVGVLAKIVGAMGGDSAFTLKAFVVLVSLVILAVLLLSEKVRLQTKRLVSRHFQRPQYDYRTVWKTFTEGTARKVEQADLCAAIVKMVSEVFQALSVTIWLLDDRNESLSFAASTSLSETKAAQLTIEPDDLKQITAALKQHPEPVDLDTCREVWAVVLRRLHPDEFRKGGNRLCIPMLAGGELLGIMTLGDRVGGIPYSLQDFDLLKSANDQAAACLLNIQLSQRLGQASQLQAFQSMSAFFVHDLKNTASTLSLMLKNLPIHFNDPAFREDALRGISRTVTHINDLISRLGVLRQEFTMRGVEADLNELLAEPLKCLDASPQVQLVKELRPLPRVKLDHTQIQSVVTNLLMNARDALSAGGQIKVNTSQQNGWVVLAVADNGCGMSREFMRHSLFRPFQTTKSKGIGIGMYQCRMVVEAHHGRIEVESELGKGTEFRVLLPVATS